MKQAPFVPRVFRGRIESGQMFRHTCFDIYCKVTRVQAGEVLTVAVDCDGKEFHQTTPYTEMAFRSKWFPAPV